MLVDGGSPFEIPPGVDPDDAIAAVLGPAMARLDMTFEDRGAYRAFWQQHPAFAGIWSTEVDAHVQHDLVGEEPEMRSAVPRRRPCRPTAASSSPTRTCAPRSSASTCR